MSLNLHSLTRSPGSRRRKKRVGRGNAAGKGTYAGRGLKGQRSRSGGRQGLKIKGLKRQIEQMPQKRGFKSIHPKLEVVNLKDIEKSFTDGETVTPKKLEKLGLVKTSRNGVKILGVGNLTKKLVFKDVSFSKTAREVIEKAGSNVN